MLIHRVLVILVELHQASDRGKDRDELLQQMGAMHRFKRAGHRSRSREDLQKDPADLRGPEGLARHAIHVAVDLVQQVGVDLEAPGSRHLEQLEEQVRTIQHPSPQLRGNSQLPAGHQEIAVHRDGRQAPSRSAVRSHGQATVHKPEQGFVEPHRMPVVLLHELLHPQEVGLIVESVQGSQPDLFVERQNFLRPPGFEVQKRPDAPQKITGLRQREKILSGEESAIRQILQRRGLEPGHAGPPKQMEVPQPSFAFLDIGLQKIDRLSKLHIFTAALLYFLLNKLPRLTADHFLRIAAMELLEQVRDFRSKIWLTSWTCES